MIALLSDMGMRDVSVAMARAVLLRELPGENVADITHQVVPYDLQQAAYLLLSSYRHFREGTINLAMVDVFAGGKPRILLAEHDGHFFIAPDNGILPLAFGILENTYLCAELSKPYAFRKWMEIAAGVIKSVKVKGSAVGYEKYETQHMLRVSGPKAMPDGVECNILYIDRYENVVLDMTRQQFEETVKGRPFRIKVARMQDITTISHLYGDVKQGEPLCRFNDAGFMELSINHDRAATLFGLSAHNSGNLRYQTIKILFQ